LLSAWGHDAQRNTQVNNADAPEQEDRHSATDYVRVYLRQMGEVPCLTKSEERSGAVGICRSRNQYHNRFFASDYILEKCLKLIRAILAGKCRLDRCVDFSLFGATKRKEDILQIFRYHGETLQKIWEQNKADFATILLPDTSVTERKNLWQRIQRRRRRAATLLQELHFRMPKVKS